MSAQKRELFSQRLLDDIKSTVELSLISKTVNSTVGSQIKVTLQMNYAINFLIAKFKFGDMVVAHAVAEREIVARRDWKESYIRELGSLAGAFVKDIIYNYNKLVLPELAIALWEEAGIAIGGEW